jgi:tryptophan synthase alpha chain
MILEKGQKERRLSVYYTAGYPQLEDTIRIASLLEKAGVDFLEIGFPYSDPVADGPVIQHSSEVALNNGMTLKHLFGQLKTLRSQVQIPAYLMGYFNPVLQYGVENFCRDCQTCGIDGVILPDLPFDDYETLYQPTFQKYGVKAVFLITPQTDPQRIREIDRLSEGFIYVLSAAATTGKALDVSDETTAYFERISQMDLRNPLVIGFGISDQKAFQKATDYAEGAIVGSAFVRLLGQNDYEKQIPTFIKQYKG